MPYVDDNLRFILDESSIVPLKRRSEGRIKTYSSSEDLRSWNFTVDDRRRHILDVVRRDIEKCGKLSLGVLYALAIKSKAELAKCLKALWEFLMARDLSEAEKEQLFQLQKEMGYACMQAINNCQCIGDYELMCVCDDETGSKQLDKIMNALQTMENEGDKLRKTSAHATDSKKNQEGSRSPCECLNTAFSKMLQAGLARAAQGGVGATARGGKGYTEGGEEGEGVDGAEGGGRRGEQGAEGAGRRGEQGAEGAGKIGEQGAEGAGKRGGQGVEGDGMGGEQGGDEDGEGNKTRNAGRRPDGGSSEELLRCPPSCPGYEPPSSKTDLSNETSKPGDQTEGGASLSERSSKTRKLLDSKTCPPTCKLFKANLAKSKLADKNESNEVDTAEQGVLSAPGTTEKGVLSTTGTKEKGVLSSASSCCVECQCDIAASRNVALRTDTGLGLMNKRMGGKICICVDKETSTPPNPPQRSVKMGVNSEIDESSEQYRNMKSKLNALECLCEEQQNSIKTVTKERDEMEKKYEQSLSKDGRPTDCKKDLEDFERELTSINRGAISPELEASIIKRELEILRQYCLKLKATEEENERLKREKSGINRRSKLRDSKSSGFGESELQELMQSTNDCEACNALKNKIKQLERRLGKCTNAMPEDFEIYKDRSALLDSTLAERDEMRGKIEKINEMQTELDLYKRKSERVDELEQQLKTAQKDKSASYDLKKVQSRCLCLQRELENVKAEKEAMQRRLELMKNEMESLRTKAKEAEILLMERDKLQIKLNDLAHVQIHNENLRLKCKCLENAANEADMYKQKYEEQLNSQYEYEMLKSQAEASTNLKRERDCLRKQVGDLQSCIIEQESEIKKLMEQIDSMIKNKDEIQMQTKDALACMRGEIERKERLIAAADKKLERMQSELKSSIQGVSCETSCYKTRIEELEMELDEAKGQIQKLEKISKDKRDSIRKLKECEYEAICNMKKDLQAANAENRKLQEIANNMAILTGDEHVQKMLKQSECAIRRVVEELSRQYKEWDGLRRERRRAKSGDSCQSCCNRNQEPENYNNDFRSNKKCELIALKLEQARMSR